ncbi:putative enoyl-CoA hydratase echA8 [compost metagenome]
MSQEQDPVLAHVSNHLGYLTLNRPAGLNALSLPMIRLLHQYLRQWNHDPKIYAVVLRGSGEKAFCAGGDIRSLYNSYKSGEHLHHVFLEEQYDLDQYIHAYGKPILALAHGFVLGGGMGLVQGVQLRVISDDTRMGMPETGIGFFPDVGGSHFLTRLPGELGTYLGVTGLHISAADALFTRLADWCVPRERLTEFEHRLETMDWKMPAVDCLRGLLTSIACPDLPGAELRALSEAIDLHFAFDTVEEICHSLKTEERYAFQDWADATLKCINNRSPLAVSVTLELLRRGRQLTLTDCFRLEKHLSGQWFEHGDLMEGVRALLVDKDKKPQWNPGTLAEMPPQRVERFFAGFDKVLNTETAPKNKWTAPCTTSN